MLLTLDMGNTQIDIGLWNGQQILLSERISTDLNKTDSEYAVLLHNLFEINQIDSSAIDGAILSSVVPPLTHRLKQAVKKITGKMPKVVGPGVKNGLKIKIEDPKSLGADIVVDSVAAIAEYGYPLIVIDMGTATTITVIDKDGNYIGGALLPGVNLSIEALSHNASKLPKIDVVAPKKVICSTTEEAMASGMVFGTASTIDGMIERMQQQLGYTCKVVATGTVAKLIVPYCTHPITLDNQLVLKGLKKIYELNP